MNGIVAVVGRPNVGKSTLFNRIVGKRMSIVDDTPGVTRDRIYAKAEWLGKKFMLVDTGGIEPDSKDVILSQMRMQAQLAIDKADVIIFVTDVTSGVTANDADVAAMLQKSGKPVVLCVNKCDGIGEVPPDFYEFYNLGLGDPIAVSSVHGHGTGDLLDAVFENMPEENPQREYSEDAIKVAVIGKPNVGKSSLVNKIAGEQRMIVSNIAGTTRDIIEENVRIGELTLRLSDTAGIRETDDIIESMGVDIAYKKIDEADLILAVFDSTSELEPKDFEIIEKLKNKNCIAVINKIDGETKIDKDFIYSNFKNIVEISAKNDEGIERLQKILEDMFLYDKSEASDGIIANERQKNCIEKALSNTIEAKTILENGEMLDAVTVMLDSAADNLMELTGEKSSEKVIDDVFSRFCVGK